MRYSKLLTDDGLAKDGHPKTTKAKGSLTVLALYAYFSDSQNAAFGLLV